MFYSKIVHEPTVHIFKQNDMRKTSLQINWFRDEIISMYFNQKPINNVQSHYQTNTMQLALLLHLMMVSISKWKEILLVTDVIVHSVS